MISLLNISSVGFGFLIARSRSLESKSSKTFQTNGSKGLKMLQKHVKGEPHLQAVSIVIRNGEIVWKHGPP